MSSLANQEDAARATAHAREEDVVFARDYAAIVEALRIGLALLANSRNGALAHSPAIGLATRVAKVCNEGDGLSHEIAYLTFCDQWGFPALLRALARAIELETK